MTYAKYSETLALRVNDFKWLRPNEPALAADWQAYQTWLAAGNVPIDGTQGAPPQVPSRQIAGTDMRMAEYGNRLAPDILEDIQKSPRCIGRTTEPTRFSDADLMERKLSYGRSGYGLQFMLSTRLSDADRYPLKLADLLVMPLDMEQAPERLIWAGSPELILNDVPNVGMGGDKLFRPVPLHDARYFPYLSTIMAIDPSGRGRDETGYAVIKSLNGFLYLMDAGGFKDGYSPETLEALATIAQRHKVQRILTEANFGDGMFTQMLKPVMMRFHPCSIEEVKHSVQKERRICDTIEPVLLSHRLVVNQRLLAKDFNSTQDYPAETAHQYQLFYQFTRVTRDKGALAHDDRLDALAMAVGYFAAQMAQDVNRSVAAARERAMKDELQKFMQHAIGRKPTGPRFAVPVGH